MKLLILTVLILVTGCASTDKQSTTSQSKFSKPIAKYTNDKKGIESLMSNEALKTFKTDYTRAPNHKALVQSDSGIWAWKSNKTSQEHATKSALIACQRFNKKNEALYPCKALNVDGEWLNK